jgi:hypothetical protein
MDSDKPEPAHLDLSALLEGLCKEKIAFILVGGLAAVIQGAPITTLDVDIVHQQTVENIQKLDRFLKSSDARYRRPDHKDIRPRTDDLKGKGHLLLTTKTGPLDILATIEKGRNYEALLPHTVEIEFRGHQLRLLHLETLIALKKGTKDAKDLQRLPILEETAKQLRKTK